MKTQTSKAVIDRMNALCGEALASPEGFHVEADSPREAMKLRQQIYAARMELRKRDPSDASPVCQIELRLEGSVLSLLKPGTIINRFKITDISSGKEVQIEAKLPEVSFSDEDLLDVMIRMAQKSGPGNYEAAAREWLSSGKKPAEFE